MFPGNVEIIQFLRPVNTISCGLHHDVFFIKLILNEQVSSAIPALMPFCAKLSAHNKQGNYNDDDEETQDYPDNFLQGESIFSW